AVSDKLTEGYVLIDKYLQQTRNAVEGSCLFKLNNSDTYILMYDVYTRGTYQFTQSTDLDSFAVIDESISMNFHPRHGTIVPITQKELSALVKQWGSVEELGITSVEAEAVRTRNVDFNAETGTLTLPLKPGSDLSAVNPQFKSLFGAEITPADSQDFSAGLVTYQVNWKGVGQTTWKVSAEVTHNPALDGYYADPEILYSQKTGKYYLYPTSDGFQGWGGTYFKTFSSPDLVNWTDEGVILDLPRDVAWGRRNAWAPAILEEKVGNDYKYYYYFTAAQKIGVAVSDNPTGPFTDSGAPLVASKPEGIRGGQEIDPDVFRDPVSGKCYLYWGNGYLAAVELNPDRISFDPKKVKILTPDRTFREGTEVLYRNGTYYFLWSENDTRSPEYRVRYATATSPMGPLTIPENNLILSKRPEAGIYGTGHNCVLQIPGRDEWYIIYHRFTRPKGITMSESAGYNREVCIDKLTFAPDGSIQPVEPTVKGIVPVQ
ncbi:MAG: family 43 glycosylhydrolase, partial [Bacteroidales bacterium]